MKLDNKDILVTGGAGFIGSQLVKLLKKKGANVHVIDDYFAGKKSLVPNEVQEHEVDITSRFEVRKIREINPDIVFHLAAIHYIPYCNENPEDAFDVNVVGTRNVLEAAREVESLEKMIFASSAAVYPPRDVSNEESSLKDPMDIYGRTKLLGEDLMKLFHEDTGVPTTAARLFNVYGPNETNSHLIPAVLKQVQNGKRTIELGNLTPQRDFVHVDDVAKAFIALAEEFDGQYRPFNVGTGVEHSVKEVVEKTSDALDQPINIEQDSDRVRESDRPHLLADTSRIENEIGWESQVELTDGLRKLLSKKVIA